MNAVEIAFWTAAALALVIWWLNRPVERWVKPWKPCRNCKRVWRRDEWGSLDYMIPLTWCHFENCTQMCPRCQEAAEDIAEIERTTNV